MTPENTLRCTAVRSLTSLTYHTCKKEQSKQKTHWSCSRKKHKKCVVSFSKFHLKQDFFMKKEQFLNSALDHLLCRHKCIWAAFSHTRTLRWSLMMVESTFQKLQFSEQASKVLTCSEVLPCPSTRPADGEHWWSVFQKRRLTPVQKKLPAVKQLNSLEWPSGMLFRVQWETLFFTLAGMKAPFQGQMRNPHLMQAYRQMPPDNATSAPRPPAPLDSFSMSPLFSAKLPNKE